MLIDISFFTRGPRQIENAKVPQETANHIAVAGRINGYIELLQPEFLRRVLGARLGSLLDAYTRVEHRESSEQEEQEEQEGNEGEQVIYEVPDERMETLAAELREPFADYVFFFMLRDMNVQPTITGLVRLKCANDYVGTIDKGVHTWNRMVDSLREFSAVSYGLRMNDVDIDRDLLTHINNLHL